MSQLTTRFTKTVGIEIPIICGAMYPCSNPELVASVSEAGGIGIIQPLSFVYVHKYNFKEALAKIKSITLKPVGMNIITEKSSQIYQKRMSQWLDEALEFGVRFFITSLGNPRWVVDRVSKFGGIVYHDTTERKWSLKALQEGVTGLICVNNEAGGHAGRFSSKELFDQHSDLGVSLICAGGIGSPEKYYEALKFGYDGIQMGTRFIATTECTANDDYKKTIVNAFASDIVLTEKVTGVPLAVINTPYVKKVGTKVGPISKYFLQHKNFKHLLRLFYTLSSAIKLKRASQKGNKYNDYYQAGKSVEGVKSIISAKEIINSFANFVNSKG